MSDVHVTPYQRRDLTLAGFILSGRWPVSTREWSQVLLLAVRLAAVPGFVPTTSLFRAKDDLPDEPDPRNVGMLTHEGALLDPGVAETHYEDIPQALFVLHPPAETQPSTPEADGAASGCILLPGSTALGLEHRAAWVEAEADGTISKLVSQVGVNPVEDPDLALMASFLAA
jgi:hypothetical protein